VLFWGAAVASMLLMGVVSTTLGRVFSASRTAADVAVLTIGSIGLGLTLLVAGRIIFVTGRIQREARRAPPTGSV
jgi:hypothetical protein